MKSTDLEFKNNNIKNMTKKYLLITALLFFSFLTQAQDKKAKDLLDQVTAKVKSYDSIIIDFKYSLNN